MASISVAGCGEMAVGKIICLLRNYKAHASEMKAEPPKEPYFFLKPSTSMIRDGGTILIPKQSANVHHEVELAVILGKRGSRICKANAYDYVAGYAVLIDVTARDIQDTAKRDGRPWAAAKGFDTFAPVSESVPITAIRDPNALDIWLKVNGEIRQRGNTSQMIFDVPTILEYVSSIMTLEPGDVIATGTPEGVGRLVAGDTVEACIESIGKMTVKVAAAP
jgi:2-keto-4-pentenoate hydratase/2-oxohepta-3-ene-1,7-dioic acid hydratase in catechol pathway